MSGAPSVAALYARISRRELHSSRSTVSIGLAIVVIAVCGWLGTEIVLRLIDQPAILAAPADLARGAASAATAPLSLMATLIGSGALVGITLMIIAVAPGRRARHQIDSERAATVVDDEVIASALAGHAARAGGINPDNTRVSISRQLATVRLVPTSGQAVHRDTVLGAVSEQLDGLNLRPALRTRVVVALGGTVGA